MFFYIKSLILVFFLQVAYASSEKSSQDLPKCSETTRFEDKIECLEKKLDVKSNYYERYKKELSASKKNFTIVPHKTNYILPYTYSSNPNLGVNKNRFLTNDGEKGNIHQSEAKFQLSFKFPIVRHFMDNQLSIWFGYTQKSFWQVYNTNISTPFRDNNYEPEILCFHEPYEQLNFFGMKNVMNTISFNHQSNGLSGDLSRCWNRLKASMVFEKDDHSLIFEPWYRIPDKSDEDDNPNIEDYMGYFKLTYAFKVGEEICDLSLWNNLDFSEDNRTSLEFNWSFPISGDVKGIAQYFNGYGESLIDYNHRNQRLGVGILLTDLL